MALTKRGARARRGISRNVRDQRGFTLIEAMMALVILTIGVAGVMSGLTTVGIANVHANEQARATSLAVQKMEQLKALPISEIKSEAAVAVDADGIEGQGHFKRKVEVVRNVKGLQTAEVLVDVEYPVGRLGKRHVRLVTLFYIGG